MTGFAFVVASRILGRRARCMRYRNYDHEYYGIMLAVRPPDGYNAAAMFRSLRPANSKEPTELPHRELISICARDRHNSSVWGEFLRRYGAKIRHFIRGTLQVPIQGLPGGLEESDLFQGVILRLVEHECAALLRFSGTTEEEWLAYLAVISRSVVRDALRRDNRQKRGGEKVIRMPRTADRETADRHHAGANHPAAEREVLAREIRGLCEREIHSDESAPSARNLLIFRLYFDHDLTLSQIASCRGVNLSKAGVDKVINRLKERVRSVAAAGESEAIM
jgi:DNA-directed RNA polymerase specialized sigma24 family protein